MTKSPKIIIKYLNKDANASFNVTKNEMLLLILLAYKTIQYQVTVTLKGEGAVAQILGIVIGAGTEQINLHTFQNHEAPHTRSNLLIKSALTDRSLLNYEGIIKVNKGAQLTDAYQRNENLLLSAEAKAETKPALEILANDVRCTHSATVGKIDADQLFYLESRGLHTSQAKTLIVTGFFQSILDKIPNISTKRNLLKKIQVLKFV